MNIVLDILEKNKGEVFLPREVAGEARGKIRNTKMLRILEDEAKKGGILKLHAYLEIDGRNERSNAYICPVGCSVPNNSPCFDPGCSDEYCPRINIKPSSTHGGIRIVKYEIARKEDIV